MPRKDSVSHEQWKLEKAFKEELYDRADAIDPDDEYEWHSLTLGWLIAKGVPIGETKDLAFILAVKAAKDEL